MIDAGRHELLRQNKFLFLPLFFRSNRQNFLAICIYHNRSVDICSIKQDSPVPKISETV